jgi:DNA-binding IclR family transcriptional regulator
MRPGLNAVAAPVFGAGARPIGYIVVIGLVSEEAARQLGPTIAQAAKALSRQLGADVEKLWGECRD